MKNDSHNEEEQYLFTKSEVMDLVRQVIKDELTVETEVGYGLFGDIDHHIVKIRLNDEVISEDCIYIGVDG